MFWCWWGLCVGFRPCLSQGRSSMTSNWVTTMSLNSWGSSFDLVMEKMMKWVLEKVLVSLNYLSTVVQFRPVFFLKNEPSFTLRMFFWLSKLIWCEFIWPEFVLCAPDDRLVEDEAISVAQSNAEGGHLSLPLQWTAWQQKCYWVSTDRKTGTGRQESRMVLNTTLC